MNISFCLTVNSLPVFSVDEPPVWLLSFDFDGTLCDPDDSPPVSPRFFEMIQELRISQKACWGINTGRSLMHTVEGIMDAKFPYLPDFLVVREREIYRPNRFSRWVGDKQWNKSCEVAHNKLFRRHRRLLAKIRKWVESKTAAVWGIQEGEPAGIVASTSSEMDFIVQYIDTHIASVREISYQRNGIYLRFSHCDYHKGTAMQEVARQLGIGSEKIFAIGDSHNDTDMLNKDIAQSIACPGNACDEVKAHIINQGGYLAESHVSAGAVEAMNALFDMGEDSKNI